mmetsp:Transcript_56635/g.104843  ORF Transcript_56635/g.104843 Transcript_56635/m.104843 type:complete len:291 (-) Transcript_56635:57-929(-)
MAIVMAAAAILAASSAKETSIAYTSNTPMPITFTLDEDLSGDVVVWYELPEMFVNQKRFIESKENEIWGNLMQTYKCDDAETVEDFTFRRGDDTAFMAGVTAAATAGGGKVHPCGLVSLSMFTDTYELRAVVDDTTEAVLLDETGISFEGEDFFYEDKLLETAQPFPNTYHIVNEVEASWLRTPADVEHFKVWTRTPPSPRVRQLWATIPGGLQAGVYQLTVTNNSPTFTDVWKVPEKRFIVAQTGTLGSEGAGMVFGILCVIFAVIEVGIAGALAVLPEGQKPVLAPFR